MTDFTEQIAKIGNDEANAKSPGALAYDTEIKQRKAKDDQRIQSQFQAAFDQTDLSVVGPSREKYDYPSDFNEGNTFKTDADGGMQINNKHYKQGTINVAGYDLTSGKRYQEKYGDTDGKIADGIEQLRKEDSNTATGPSYRHVDGLHSVASGILNEGGSFDDFMQDAQGPWSVDQMVIAWQSANTTKRTMSDIDDTGKRIYSESVRPPEGEQTRLGMELPSEPYTEEQLSTDKDWLDGGRRFISHFRKDVETMSDEEVDDLMKTTMGMNKWNLPLMMYFVNEAQDSKDPQFAQDMLNLMDQYDHLEYSWPGTGRATIGALADPVNYITFGGGILTTRLAAAATKQGVRNTLRGIAAGTAYDVVLGAAEGGGYNVMQQQAEVAAGAREEIDPAEAVTAGAITAGVVGAIGGPLNIATDKTARGFAADKIKGAWNWSADTELQSAHSVKSVMDEFDLGEHFMHTADAGNIKAQPPVTANQKVNTVSKLQEWVATLPNGGAKPITIRQKVKEGINKGLIKPQEVKWSGIEKFIDRAEKEGGFRLSKSKLLDHLKTATPQPKMVSTSYPAYDNYSLGYSIGVTDGYDERLIVIPGKSQQWQSHHFGDQVGPAPSRRGEMDQVTFEEMSQDKVIDETDAVIAHSRIERGTFGGQKGKMVLEIQSDWHTKGQRGGYAGTSTGPIAKVKDGQVDEIPFELLKIAEENGVDPYDKNALALIWDKIPQDYKKIMDEGKPDSMPYGKDWDTMGMRQEIQDSINNGDDFIAWPSTSEQISYIEQWGGAYEDSGIAKRVTKDRIKAMNKLGLEPKLKDIPEYKDVKRPYGSGYQGWDSGIDEELAELGQILFIDNSGDYHLYANPQGLDWEDFADDAGNALANVPGAEKLKTFTQEEYPAFVEKVFQSQDTPIDPKFWVIELTDEVKKKFRKEGMPLYSIAGAAPVAMEKEDDK